MPSARHLARSSLTLEALQVTAFKSGNKWRILIASYENIRKHYELLKGAIDLLVCDEGHRLKSTGGNNTMAALLHLNCPRRLILTGTPVQNNLKECASADCQTSNNPRV
jgi:DNA repair and recombination protein RAD54B